MTSDDSASPPASPPGAELARAIARTRHFAARRLSIGTLWTRGAAARDRYGLACCPLDEEALFFSVDGVFVNTVRPEKDLFQAFICVLTKAVATVLQRPVVDALATLDDPTVRETSFLMILRVAENLALHGPRPAD